LAKRRGASEGETTTTDTTPSAAIDEADKGNGE
jgi:hypothetical protein